LKVKVIDLLTCNNGTYVHHNQGLSESDVVLLALITRQTGIGTSNLN